MGKNKNKGFKMAKKKVAPEKFLVVVNAWGLSRRSDFDASDINNIGAWFEFMLRDDHPNLGIQAMYYQRTHRNIIVELPREVKDVTNYLGRHYYSQFLTHSPHSENYADIYEYKYSLHGDPGEKNWSIGYPTYKEIPKGIPLANPYPCPGTSGAPPVDVADYAYPIPPFVYERRLQRLTSELQMRAAAAATNSEHSTFSSTLESSLPSGSSKNGALSNSRSDKDKGGMVDLPSPIGSEHTTPTEAFPRNVQKLDPYEEDESATRSLRFPQTEIKDEADDFLSSLIGKPKSLEGEMLPITSDMDEDEYEPSTELLAMLGTLPPELNADDIPQQDDLDAKFDIKIKPEPIDDLMPEYQPSEDLLETLSSLPQDFFSSEANDSQEAPYIKSEFESYTRSVTPTPFKIKEEPGGFSIPNPPIKSEPVDDDGAIDFQSRDYRGASRDSRIRRPETSNMTDNKRRYSPTYHGLSKRVKIEDDR